MKKYSILLLAGFLAVACTKDNADNNALIAGTWELRQSIGGIGGTLKFEPGNGYRLVFEKNNQYNTLVPVNANSIPQHGPYQLKQSARPGNWLLQRAYELNGRTIILNDSVRFEHNQILFFPEASCCDIPLITYEKLP